MAEPAPNTSILLRRAEAVGRQIISRLRTESGPVRLRTEPTPPRPRAVSGPVHPRAASCPVRLRADSGSVRLRTDSGPVQLRLSVDTVRIRTISVAVPPGTKPDIVQPPPPPPAPRPSEYSFLGGYKYQVLMCGYRNTEALEKVVLRIVLIS